MLDQDLIRFVRSKFEEKYRVRINERLYGIAVAKASSIIQKLDAQKKISGNTTPATCTTLNNDLNYASRVFNDLVPSLKSKNIC